MTLRSIGIFLLAVFCLIVLVPPAYTLLWPDPTLEAVLVEQLEHWPGQVTDLSACPHLIHISEYVVQPRFECDLGGGVRYFADASHFITSLQIKPEQLRVGAGILAYGSPTTHERMGAYHFLAWNEQLPRVTMIARQNGANWLMSEVMQVFMHH